LFSGKAALVVYMDNIQERQPLNLPAPIMMTTANFQDAWGGGEGEEVQGEYGVINFTFTNLFH